jgi:hypothetical protein
MKWYIVKLPYGMAKIEKREYHPQADAECGSEDEAVKWCNKNKLQVFDKNALIKSIRKGDKK